MGRRRALFASAAFLTASVFTTDAQEEGESAVVIVYTQAKDRASNSVERKLRHAAVHQVYAGQFQAYEVAERWRERESYDAFCGREALGLAEGRELRLTADSSGVFSRVFWH